VFLDLIQHYMLSVYEIDEKKRVKLLRELVGVPRLLQPEAGPSAIPRWAPAWWNGDEDATASNMSAMKALKRG
jgi:hypothetical protein